MTQASSINSQNISLEGEKKKFFSAAFMHNAVQNVKNNIKLIIVLFVLHMAAAPLVLTAAICQIPTYSNGLELDIYMVIASISTFMGAAGGIICALSVFSYLYKKSDVDMRMSLPMTTSQRFVSDFLSGLFLYIVPFIAAQIFTGVLMLIGHLTLDGKTFYRSPEYSGGTVDTTGWVCDFFESIAPILWRGILGGLMLLLMFYAVTVIAAACCGNVFESVSYNIILNVLVPLAVYIGCLAVSQKAVGLDIDRIIYKPMTFCGPGGAAVGLVMALESVFLEITNERNNNIASFYDFGQWCVIALILALVFSAAAFLIYRKRKAEDTGKPVVFGLFYHIIMALCVFCISYAFLMESDDYIIPMIIITALLYMIFHVERNRGFSHIIKGAVMYAAALGVCAGSFAVIDATHALGVGKYVPDPKDVVSVTVPYNGVYDQESYGYMYSYSGPYSTLSNEESIKTITDIHRNYVEHYIDNGDFSYGASLEIAYKLKSGRTVFRRISIDGNAITALSRLDMTEEMKQQRAEAAENNILWQAKIAQDLTEIAAEDGKKSVTVSLSPQWRYSVGNTNMDGTISLPYLQMPPDFTQNLAAALKNDILRETPEEYYTPSGKVYYLKIGSLLPIAIIKDSYTEALACLRISGFTELPENTENIAQSYMSSSMDISMDNTTLRKKMSGEDSVTVTAGCPVDTSSFNSADGQCYNISIPRYTHVWYISENHASADMKYTEDLNTLLDVSKKMYISDRICYTINVDGTTAAIPAEYNELAERVFIRMAADYFMNCTAKTQVYGDPSGENIFFIRSFTELYGRDKIVSALEYYYGSPASDICDAMFDFASQNNG